MHPILHYDGYAPTFILLRNETVSEFVQSYGCHAEQSEASRIFS